MEIKHSFVFWWQQIKKKNVSVLSWKSFFLHTVCSMQHFQFLFVWQFIFEHMTWFVKGEFIFITNNNLFETTYKSISTYTLSSINWYFVIVSVPTEKFVKVVDGLAIKKVSKNDSGEYTCKAFQISTTISNVKEQTIRLNIQRK